MRGFAIVLEHLLVVTKTMWKLAWELRPACVRPKASKKISPNEVLGSAWICHRGRGFGLGWPKQYRSSLWDCSPRLCRPKATKRVLPAKCSGVPGFAIVLEHLLWGGQNKTEARFGLAARLLALQKQHKDGSKRSARERLDLLSSSSTAFVAT